MVAPRRGAWIEIVEEIKSRYADESHPAGVRGLKYIDHLVDEYTAKVAPRRGAWIEIVYGEVNDKNCYSRAPQGCVD